MQRIKFRHVITAVTDENVFTTDNSTEDFQQLIIASGELSENENPVFWIIFASPEFDAISLSLVSKI